MKKEVSIFVVLLVGLTFAGCSTKEDETETPPRENQAVIDIHMHTYQWNRYGENPPPNYISGKVPAARTDIEALEAYEAVMKQYNIVLAVGSAEYDMATKWKEYAPDKFYVGQQFPRNTTPGKPRKTIWPDIAELRKRYKNGELQIMGEVMAQYAGVYLNDPVMEPYFAMAEEMGIPVCLHSGFGEPMLPYTSDPDFRMRYGNPLFLEDVLVKHPDLKVYIAHGGYPYQDETIALMLMYQQVYMDISAINWILPREEFHRYIKPFFDLYMGKRIMFGSDQMIWPDAVGMGIEAVESADFLSEEQKRDVFYNNAARFLGLE